MGSSNLISVGSTLQDLRRAVQKLASLRLNADSTPTFASLTLSGLTTSRLLATDSSSILVSSDLYSWITETANQVLIADDGDGSITLSTPQNIHTGATPTFADLTLSSPSNIYDLSHDSFADFVASEHLNHALALDADLIVWLRMDDVDGSGNPVDLGSESMSWTILNDAAQTDDGVIGKAFTFDGTTDAIIGPEPPSGLPLGTASRTIFARVRVDDSSANRSILYYGDSAGGTGGQWSVLVLTDGKIIIGFVGGSMRTTSTVFKDGKWHSIGMTYDTNDGAAISNIKFYVDGVFDTATNISAIDLDTDNAFLRVGILDNNASPMNGNIDDVRIYGRSLTADEMLELHQLGTLDAMTAFTAAYFKEYVASRSGYFNRLHVSESLVAGDIAAEDIVSDSLTTDALTVANGGLTAFNGVILTGTGDILPDSDNARDIGSLALTYRDLFINTILIDEDGTIGISGGVTLGFDNSNSFFEFTGGDIVLGGTSAKTRLTVEGTITLKEQAAADGDTAAYGQLWVKNDSPCSLYFTDDTGVDIKLGLDIAGLSEDTAPQATTDYVATYDDSASAHKKVLVEDLGPFGSVSRAQTINLLQSDSAADIQAKIDAVGKYIFPGHTITFQFETGGTHTLNNVITFRGFLGAGRIIIQGNLSEAGAASKHTTQDTILDFNNNTSGLEIENTSVYVLIRNLKIIVETDVADTKCIVVDVASRVEAWYNYYVGNSTSRGSGFQVRYCVFGMSFQCLVNNLRYGLVSAGSRLHAWDNDDTGTQPLYGLWANQSSHIGKQSTQPSGSIANELIDAGSQII